MYSKTGAIGFGDIEQMQESIQKFNELRILKLGDVIKLKSGEEVEFMELKRKKFVFRRDNNLAYQCVIEMFDSVVEKKEVVKNTSYASLKPGEAFYIQSSNGKDALLFKFKELKNNKIVGVQPINQMIFNIDVNLYRGKVSEL